MLPIACRRLLLPWGAMMLLLGCAPATSKAPDPGPVFRPWTGPIETIALVMTPPSGAARNMAESAYNLSLVELLRHPYSRQRFDVVDRNTLERVLAEQRLGASGLVEARTAPQVGRLLGARHMLVADLASVDSSSRSVGGIPWRGGSVVGMSATVVTVLMVMRLVDVETGRVVASGTGHLYDSILTGFSVDRFNLASAADQSRVLNIVSQAARRALDELFQQIH